MDCEHTGFVDSFLHLLRDPAHWSFELLVSVVFLAIETIVFWPLIKRFRSHHKDDDQDISDLKQEVADLKILVLALQKPTESPPVCSCRCADDAEGIGHEPGSLSGCRTPKL